MMASTACSWPGESKCFRCCLDAAHIKSCAGLPLASTPLPLPLPCRSPQRAKTDTFDGLEWDNPDRPEARNLLTIYQCVTGGQVGCGVGIRFEEFPSGVSNKRSLWWSWPAGVAHMRCH